MTTLHLKVAVTISELESISRCAEKLNISQSNVSSYLKSLENEIGFAIFNRSKLGTTLTNKGRIFIEHAKKILAEQESIMKIQHQENIYRLRLGTANYSVAIEPFLKLYKNHINDHEVDVCYMNVSIDKGVKALEEFKLDIVVVPALKSQIAGLVNVCKKNNLSMISVYELPTVINVRANHPALNDERIKDITQGCDVMKDYPYVTYNNLFTDSTAVNYKDSDFAQCSYKIYVDGKEARTRLISTSNAFTFGIISSKEVRKKYNIVSFPVKGVSVEIYCLIRESEADRVEIQEYISLFKEELKNLVFD